MIITPIQASAVSAAIEQQLTSFGALMDAGATVERSDEVNEDPGLCPWVGVYRARTVFSIRTLGAGSGFRRQDFQVLLLIQDESMESGKDCEEKLDARIADVVSALLMDPTLGGVVDMLTEFIVTYESLDKLNDNQYFQTASLELTAVGQVGVS